VTAPEVLTVGFYGLSPSTLNNRVSSTPRFHSDKRSMSMVVDHPPPHVIRAICLQKYRS